MNSDRAQAARYVEPASPTAAPEPAQPLPSPPTTATLTVTHVPPIDAGGEARGESAYAEDAEVPTRTTPFSERIERQLQASALKGKLPEDATP